MRRLPMLVALAAFAPATLARPCFAPCFDVIELADGSRLVGEVRNTQDGVLLDGPLGRLHLERAKLHRVERRNDLLPAFRVARSAADGKAHALAMVVALALDRGLYPEAFDAWDDAASAGLDATTRAELLARLRGEALLDGCCASLPPTDEETQRKLLARIAAASPSRATIARELLATSDRIAFETLLADRLANGTPAERRGSALLLSSAPSDRQLSRLIRASLLDSDEKVRDLARAGALATGHPQLAVPYLKALEVDDSTFRERAYPALAEIRDPRAVEGLIAMLEPRAAPAGGAGGSSPPRAHVFFGEQRAFVRDFDVEIAQGAVIAKPVIGVLQSGVLLDVAVAGVFVVPASERRVALGALRRLTGREGDADPVAWRSWWSGQGGVLPPVAPQSASMATTGG